MGVLYWGVLPTSAHGHRWLCWFNTSTCTYVRWRYPLLKHNPHRTVVTFITLIYWHYTNNKTQAERLLEAIYTEKTKNVWVWDKLHQTALMTNLEAWHHHLKTLQGEINWYKSQKLNCKTVKIEQICNITQKPNRKGFCLKRWKNWQYLKWMDAKLWYCQSSSQYFIKRFVFDNKNLFMIWCLNCVWDVKRCEGNSENVELFMKWFFFLHLDPSASREWSSIIRTMLTSQNKKTVLNDTLLTW